MKVNKRIFFVVAAFMALAFLAGIGVAALIFGRTLTVRHELSIPPPNFHEWVGEKQEQALAQLQETRQAVAKQKGYSSWQEYEQSPDYNHAERPVDSRLPGY